MFADAAERPMITDRPDTTESPYTVPAGRFQIEASFLDYSKDRSAAQGRRYQRVFGQMNIKRGLAQDTDLQLAFNTHSFAGQVEGGDRSYSEGFGDVTLRLKRNIWGNDAGKTAFGLMPYVTFPTHTRVSEKAWASGIIFPLAWTLPNGWTLGMMEELDFRDRAADGAGRFQSLHSATLGIALSETVGSYWELVSIAGFSQSHQLSANAGLTFQIGPNLVFDTGSRIGLTRSAPDIGLFSGVSLRF